MLNAAIEAALLLNLRGFHVVRTVEDSIRLRTPATAMNAAGWLRSQGVDATARIIDGQWAVTVAEKGI